MRAFSMLMVAAGIGFWVWWYWVYARNVRRVIQSIDWARCTLERGLETSPCPVVAYRSTTLSYSCTLAAGHAGGHVWSAAARVLRA